MKASLFNYVSHWLLPGLIAGAVYLIITLVAGALTTTVWAMPDGIAQTVGIGAPAGHGFALEPLLVGVAIHLLVSIGLGVIFIAIARWWRLHGWVLVAVVLLFATVEPAIAIWVVLHNLLPTTTFFFFLQSIPLWGSILGHYAYGLILGLLLYRLDKSNSKLDSRESRPAI